MATDNQIAVKKRLIYAEDLFEPVDFKVFIAGRSGGKTMAMYEQIFRQRVEMAPTIDAAPVVHGHWQEWWPPAHMILTGEEMLYRCSACDAKYADVSGYKFCPHCGAMMEENHGGNETDN